MMPRRPICFALLSYLAALLIQASVSGAFQEQEFDAPFEALVLRDRAPVHSGPGEEHYTTLLLGKGEVVEVQRIDPGGWMAITPSWEEFSLLPQSAVEFISDSEAEVVSESVQIWVGTRTGAVENPMWQVKLRRGDRVEVLGQIDWPSSEGPPTTWLQIAPPAGEYRWIHRSHLQFPDRRTQLPEPHHESQAIAAEPLRGQLVDHPWPELPPKDARRNDSGPTRRAFVDSLPTSTAPVPDPFTAVEQTPRQQASENEGWRRAASPIRIAEQMPVSVTSIAAPNPSANNEFNRQAGARPDPRPLTMPMSAPLDYQSQQPVAPSINELLSDRLRELDLRIGMEIVKPAEHWQLMTLADSLRQIQMAPFDERERQQAGLLQSKLQRLQQTQNMLLNTNRLPVAMPSQDSRPVASSIEPVVQGVSYDAVGWLNELVQNHGAGQTTYVLQDDSGKILYHISPEPGLNLHRYLRTKIGVKGMKGYNQRLKLEHVAAQRVVVLEKSPALTR